MPRLRSMKNAPRDGTQVLLFADGHQTFIGYWGNPYRYRRADKEAWIGHEWGLHEDHDIHGWLHVPERTKR